MKTKIKVLLGFVAGVLVSVIIPLLLLATGAINMAADVKPGFVERTIAPWARDRSVESRSPAEEGPFDGDPAAIAVGLDHFRENCVMCHGAPGVSGAELSQGLNPQAPSLGKESDDTPDGEIFWVIKHGIRMTGMPAFGPTHTDEEIWKIVAFIQHLPNLTPEERESLQAVTEEKPGHHENQPATAAAQTKEPEPARDHL